MPTLSPILVFDYLHGGKKPQKFKYAHIRISSTGLNLVLSANLWRAFSSLLKKKSKKTQTQPTLNSIDINICLRNVTSGTSWTWCC